MTSKKSKKGRMSLYIALIIIGCVFIGWGNLILHEYVNFVIVLGCFGVGLFGVMKAIGSSGKKESDKDA